MRRKRPFNLHALLLQMPQNSGELIPHAFFKHPAHAFKLWEILCVDQPPIFMVHQVNQAPENRFFFLYMN